MKNAILHLRVLTVNTSPVVTELDTSKANGPDLVSASHVRSHEPDVRSHEPSALANDFNVFDRASFGDQAGHSQPLACARTLLMTSFRS
jgi:hypothetical protein